MENIIHKVTLPMLITGLVVGFLVLLLFYNIFSRRTNITGIISRDLFANIINIYQGQNGAGELIKIKCFPHASPHFVERESQYTELQNAINICRQKLVWWERMVVIYGFGGMGKSELTKVFVTNESSKYDYVYWINAESEKTLVQSFKVLAKMLALSVSFEDCNDCQVVYNHLANKYQSGLFIFDSADRLHTDGENLGIKNYLPTASSSNHPTMIVTSRHGSPEWGGLTHLIKTINVDVLEITKSVQLLKKYMRIDNLNIPFNLEESLKYIAKELMGYPLGLSLVSTTISDQSSVCSLENIEENIREYMEVLQTSSFAKLSHESKLMALLELIYSKAISSMVLKPYGAFALEIIQLCAGADFPGLTIWEIENLCFKNQTLTQHKISEASFPVRQGLKLLSNYSLVKIVKQPGENGYYDTISIHKLIQLTARQYLIRKHQSIENFVVNTQKFDVNAKEFQMSFSCTVKVSTFPSFSGINLSSVELLTVFRWKLGNQIMVHNTFYDSNSITFSNQDLDWYVETDRQFGGPNIIIRGNIKCPPVVATSYRANGVFVDLLFRISSKEFTNPTSIGADVLLLELLQICWEQMQASEVGISACKVSWKAHKTKNVVTKICQCGPVRHQDFRISDDQVNILSDDPNMVVQHFTAWNSLSAGIMGFIGDNNVVTPALAAAIESDSDNAKNTEAQGS